MSAELLPEWMNLFLDDFETSLCLPILVVIILCTAQFVFNHIYDIVRIIYQTVREPAAVGAQNNMMGKLKGILTTLGIGNTDTAATPNPTSPIGADSPEEGWDYCDDYCELE